MLALPLDVADAAAVGAVAEKARMLQEADLGQTIRFIAELPDHVCINEWVISPVWNRIDRGGGEMKRQKFATR